MEIEIISNVVPSRAKLPASVQWGSTVGGVQCPERRGEGSTLPGESGRLWELAEHDRLNQVAGTYKDKFQKKHTKTGKFGLGNNATR